MLTTRPDSTEYPPYYGKYIGRVPESDIAKSVPFSLAQRIAIDSLTLKVPRASTPR